MNVARLVVRPSLLFVLSYIAFICNSTPVCAGSEITGVRLSRAFFNPTIGETIHIEFEASADGFLNLAILDRDGFLVRKLATDQPIKKGTQKITWDGRADTGEIVPDESYSLKIDIRSSDQVISYFPANIRLEEVKAEVGDYDRQNRVLTYKLPKASRIHAHAGSAVLDTKTNTPMGPVLKTLVNREVRPAGAVIEHWAGYDESGTIYVPGLPNFVVSISASELPENSILSTGNSRLRFVETIKTRKGKSQFTFSEDPHEHHRGLATMEDVSPSMKLRPLNAVWSDKDKAWVLSTHRGEWLGYPLPSTALIT